MSIRLTLKPGQKGTKKLVAHYGDQLVCVRYRYDAEAHKRYKTVELIVEAVDWIPQRDRIVPVRVAFEEKALQQQIKAAGGQWNRQMQVWEVRYDQVQALGLEERIVRDAIGAYEILSTDQEA